ncbi:hypothetical protein MSAN_02052900 [Mycena sanguinolenta]|uniref:DUF6533 domain-containing protein n=1 Tax=Mycena sanguinolenta TaxID=230812 RepID=A0A8H7CMK7_9AGAR|nr:hypothetical protein MSAN_02052900 [Mycena sanguinolenta]
MPSHTPVYNPNYLQGSATAALTWVVYDVCLTLDREIASVWRASWTVSKVLFLFSRYHTILALGFFLMEAIGTKHFTLPLSLNQSFPAGASIYAPCIANLQVSVVLIARLSWSNPSFSSLSSRASRWYLGLTEVFSILAGELLILIRINAVYGWSRKMVAFTLFLFCAETVIGLTTTIISLTGGSRGLAGSTEILSCSPGSTNVPDINVASKCTSMAVACIYLGLILNKAIDGIETIMTLEGPKRRSSKLGLFSAFKSEVQMTPTLYLCLRDAAFYFLLVLGVLLVNLVLIVTQNRYAQMGTAWLLATYSPRVDPHIPQSEGSYARPTAL